MNPPTVGTPVPDVALLDQDGVERRLAEYKGAWLLVYFYPKDNTPGCTLEACAIRDEFPKFEGVAVIGISPDSVKSHKKFAENFNLPFTLLADEQHIAAEAFGVWGEKSFMGRKYQGVDRASFLVDPAGIIRKVYPKVKPTTHAQEVLADLHELRGA